MSLELSKVLPQIEELGRSAAVRSRELAQRIPEAHRSLKTAAEMPLEMIHQKLVRTGEGWIGAKPTDEPLDSSIPAPAHPPKLNIIGADGSQIYPDRHGPFLYYLINIGSLHIRHGSASPPEASSRPILFFEDEDLHRGTGSLISAELINGRRDIAEIGELADLAEGCPQDEPVLALLDNGLLLWLALQVQDHPRADVEPVLQEYYRHLDRLKASAAALAGFVDRPRNTNVLSLLHLIQLPIEAINEANLQANPYRGLVDRALFAGLLGPGERSARFTYASRLNEESAARGHQIQFFYLNPGAGNQIARIEVPSWVSERPLLLDWVHAAILEQCRTTGGFPYVLVRAHELAVVTHAERQTLEGMLSKVLLDQGLEPRYSQKERTKQWTRRRRRHRL